MRCANPGCQAEALYFRSGSLHWIDSQPQWDGADQVPATLIIWLCAACSESVLVQTWRPAGQQLRRAQGEVIPMDRDRRRPSVRAAPEHPVSQSA